MTESKTVEPLPLSLHPSLEPFAREWLGGGVWTRGPRLRGCPWWLPVEGDRVVWLSIDRVIPLHVPVGRALLVAWLAAGERCLHCRSDRDGECSWGGCPQLRDGEPEASGRHCPLDTIDDPEEGCCRCNDTGYLREPYPDHSWLADYPEALRESVVRVARGEEPLTGWLPAWRQDDSVLVRDLPGDDSLVAALIDPDEGWSCSVPPYWTKHSGPETGDEAKAIVDRHLREAGYCLKNTFDDGPHDLR